MWTLVVCLTAGCVAVEGPKVIVVDGFKTVTDCRYFGQLNLDLLNPTAVYRCDKTGKPSVRCLPDLRKYGRTAECITSYETQHGL